jgi:hypothetical protein
MRLKKDDKRNILLFDTLIRRTRHVHHSKPLVVGCKLLTLSNEGNELKKIPDFVTTTKEHA